MSDVLLLATSGLLSCCVYTVTNLGKDPATVAIYTWLPVRCKKQIGEKQIRA